MAQNGWACELALLNMARRAAGGRERDRGHLPKGVDDAAALPVGHSCELNRIRGPRCLVRGATTGERSRSQVPMEVADSPSLVGELARIMHYNIWLKERLQWSVLAWKLEGKSRRRV